MPNDSDIVNALDDWTKIPHRATETGMKLFNERYARVLEKHLRKYLRSLHDVEDAMQDIRLKVLCSITEFDHSRDLGGWVWTIARNHLVDLIRKKYRDCLTRALPLTTEFEDILLTRDDLSLDTDGEDEADLVAKWQRLFNDLTASQRALMQLKLNGVLPLDKQDHVNQTDRELAAALGKSKDCIRQLLLKARRVLKKLVDEGQDAA